jgi:transposase
MMGERRMMPEALFYGFSLERHVPDDHLLRKIDRFIDLSGLRAHLGPYYSDVGRPSIDPELMMRMLIVGYGFGIRSERRLCEEVHLNLAYRWFCRLRLDGDVRADFLVADAVRPNQSPISWGLAGAENFPGISQFIREPAGFGVVDEF